jgi:hypothetical protein
VRKLWFEAYSPANVKHIQDVILFNERTWFYLSAYVNSQESCMCELCLIRTELWNHHSMIKMLDNLVPYSTRTLSTVNVIVLILYPFTDAWSSSPDFDLWGAKKGLSTNTTPRSLRKLREVITNFIRNNPHSEFVRESPTRQNRWILVYMPVGSTSNL